MARSRRPRQSVPNLRMEFIGRGTAPVDFPRLGEARRPEDWTPGGDFGGCGEALHSGESV